MVKNFKSVLRAKNILKLLMVKSFKSGLRAKS